MVSEGMRMIDREKVVNGLECCARQDLRRNCRTCPIGLDLGCATSLKLSALELLKAEEPVKPDCIVTTGAGIPMARCPKCGTRINENHNPNYCGVCGRAVKWE